LGQLNFSPKRCPSKALRNLVQFFNNNEEINQTNFQFEKEERKRHMGTMKKKEKKEGVKHEMKRKEREEIVSALEDF
jgi:hypothetical protein